MNKHIVRIATSVGLIAVLAACGGAQSVVPRSQLPQNATSASIVIKIPSAATSGQVRAKYISAATQSIGGTITPGVGCTGCSSALTVAANLTPTTNGCTTSGSGTTCTVPLALNPGSYTASITTFDAINQGGNKLSSNQAVPITITANAANTVAMTLSGIPTTVTLALSGTPPATLASGALTIDGLGTAVTISMTAKDADGNTIIGAGAPAIASAIVTGNTSYVTNASASTFTLTTPATGSRTPATVTVNLSNCPAGGVCASTLTANITELLAVPDETLKVVKIYNERTQALTSTTIALTKPTEAIFDRKGNLWIGDSAAVAVYEVAPPYTGAATTTITNGIVSASGEVMPMAFDSSGNLFVGSYFGGNVTEYAPPYTGAPIATLGGGNHAPAALIVDSADNLWVTTDAASYHAMFYPKPVSAATGVSLSAATNCQGVTEYTPGSVLLSCITGATTGNNLVYTTAGAYVATESLNEAFYFVIPTPATYGTGFIGTDGNGATSQNDSEVFATSTITPNLVGGNPITGTAMDENNTLFSVSYNNGVLYSSTYPYTNSTLVSGAFTKPWMVSVWP